jgi:hypothetical protein
MMHTTEQNKFPGDKNVTNVGYFDVENEALVSVVKVNYPNYDTLPANNSY